MEFSMERISPAKAKEMLSTNKRNRRLSCQQVKFFMHHIRNKTWDPHNGCAIRFNKKGELVDGQHRLSAIVRCGRTITVLVCRGVSNNAFETIDSGKRRSLSDCLSVEGYKHTTNLASAVRVVASIYEKPFAYINVTNADGMDLVHQHPKLVDSLNFVVHGETDRLRFGRLVGLGRLAGVHYVAATRKDSNIDTADWFVERVLMGDELKKGSPILQYRSHIISCHDDDISFHREQSLLLLVKTWNSWRTGNRLNFKRKDTDTLEME